MFYYYLRLLLTYQLVIFEGQDLSSPVFVFD